MNVSLTPAGPIPVEPRGDSNSRGQRSKISAEFKHRYFLYLFATIIFMVLAGCAPTWTQVDATPHVAKGRFSIQLPTTWLKISVDGGAGVMASRDGPVLQTINARFLRYAKAFPQTKVEPSQETLSFELMEYYIAEFKASAGSQVLEVDSREAVTIGGRNGFRVAMSYKNDDGLRFQLVAYGCSDAEGIYSLTYQAPTLHYFAKNLDDFEKTIATFKIL